MSDSGSAALSEGGSGCKRGGGVVIGGKEKRPGVRWGRGRGEGMGGARLRVSR